MSLRDRITIFETPAVATAATTATPSLGSAPYVATVATRTDSVDEEWGDWLVEWGDLRPCLWCVNLARSGRCLAAARGELRAARDYAPTFPGQPQRCVGYVPTDNDPDLRPGRERWPELIEWQTRMAEK